MRVFTGADACGRPTQMSRTVRGGKRDAQKLAAQLEASSGDAEPAGRLVADVLDEWVKQNLDTRAPSSARAVMTLSQSMTHRSGSPCSGPTSTSVRFLESSG